ncbi:DUF2750 domain-containing protein [Cloacibacterium normanense]|uniref:DUF2750 domain-containing protein n=1 Tax=Cloacibacterium normanense TaxID=237258 RepID=UPI00391C9597
MNLKTQEIESVIKLEPFERYKYSLKRIADNETLYTIKRDNETIAISDLDDEKLIPFWSAKQFAELNITDEWNEFYVEEISLDDFENEIVDFINENNFLMNIFPINNKTGFVVSLDEFIRDLNIELERF